MDLLQMQNMLKPVMALVALGLLSGTLHTCADFGAGVEVPVEQEEVTFYRPGFPVYDSTGADLGWLQGVGSALHMESPTGFQYRLKLNGQVDGFNVLYFTEADCEGQAYLQNYSRLPAEADYFVYYAGFLYALGATPNFSTDVELNSQILNGENDCTNSSTTLEHGMEVEIITYGTAGIPQTIVPPIIIGDEE